ncbi:hypothetical protein AAG570_005080 [Ranatra chinensis]|uniref:Protein brambleberry-like n=1 Tax=Ranatra chinensis TaxID=642074 RepID=A0ABD0YEB8_9HEMI
MSRFKTVLLLFFSVGIVRGSFFEWLGWSDPQESLVSNGVPLMKVPFEELSPEEKFLVEASKITGLHLSQLDTCQHKLVMKLKSSCGSLSEEDLAKLSVNLLNCQLAVEGRQEFPCSENMSLKACTRDMDAETWNAYHVIGNRARAVCYAARQQQFRALSEMTVNKLMSTVHKQIVALTSLQEQQDNMASLAVTTMNELSKGTKEVIKSHNAVRFSQTSMTEGVNRNLKQLETESILIENMHKEFTDLMIDLQQKIGAASKQVEQQSLYREQEHNQLLTDFKGLSSSASNLRHKIDKSGMTVTEQNKISGQQFKETLEHLRDINASITYMSQLVTEIRSHFDKKMGLVTYAIGKNVDVLLRWIYKFYKMNRRAEYTTRDRRFVNLDNSGDSNSKVNDWLKAVLAVAELLVWPYAKVVRGAKNIQQTIVYIAEFMPEENIDVLVDNLSK